MEQQKCCPSIICQAFVLPSEIMSAFALDIKVSHNSEREATENVLPEVMTKQWWMGFLLEPQRIDQRA